MNQLLLSYADRQGFEYEPIRGAGGDGGVDGLVRQGGVPGLKGPVAFQFKWLWQDIHKGSKAAQIRDSLQRAGIVFGFVEHWILVTPSDLNPKERDWLLALETPSGFTLHHWGQERIEQLFQSCPGLFARYYPHEARPLVDAYSGFDFKEFAAAYTRKVTTAFWRLRTIGLPPEALRQRDAQTEMPLSEIFVPVRLHPEQDSDQAVNLSDVLNRGKSCVFMGDPGTGKSTLLMFLALLFAGKASLPGFTPRQGMVPLFVSLRDFVRLEQQQPGLSLLEYWEMRARSDLGLAHAHRAFFEATLRMQEAVILVDGLDEVGGETVRRRVAIMIENMRSSYGECLFYVTTRLYGYVSPVRLPAASFDHFRVARLNDPQIDTFVTRWYRIQYPNNERERLERTDSLQQALRHSPRVRQLAGNPLLLTLMAFIHHGLGTLPQDRGELYEKCIEMLLKTWREARDAGQLGRPTDRAGEVELPIHVQKDYLAHAALDAQERSDGTSELEARGLIPRKDVIASLTRRHLERARRSRPHLQQGEAQEEMEEFLDDICDQTGLIVDRGGGLVSFIHLSFQEYLAAWVFTCGSVDLSQQIAFFNNYLGDPNWEEVVLLRLYIVLRTPGIDGESAFDSIISAEFRRLNDAESTNAWLTLARAVRDDLDFTPQDAKSVLTSVLTGWLASPSFSGDSHAVLEEICIFTERARDILQDLIDDTWLRADPQEAIAALHLRTELFGFPQHAPEALQQRADLTELVPDLIAFSSEPSMIQLLSQHATVEDWFEVLLHADSPDLMRTALDWATAHPADTDAAPAYRAATAWLYRKIVDELLSRARFVENRPANLGKSLLRQTRSLRIANELYDVCLPFTALRAAPVTCLNEVSRKPTALHCPALLTERLTKSTNGDATQKQLRGSDDDSYLVAWARQFLQAHLPKAHSADREENGDIEEFARRFVREFLSDVITTGESQGSENVGTQLVADFADRFACRFASDTIREFLSLVSDSFAHRHSSAIRPRSRIVNAELPYWEEAHAQLKGQEERVGALLEVALQRALFEQRAGIVEHDRTTTVTGAVVAIKNPFSLPLVMMKIWQAAVENHQQAVLRHVSSGLSADWRGEEVTNFEHPALNWDVPLLTGARYNGPIDTVATEVMDWWSIGRWFGRSSRSADPLPKENVDLLASDEAIRWLQRHSLDVYRVAMQWEEHATRFAKNVSRLEGPKGALFIAYAAYTTLMTGFDLQTTAWNDLLSTCDLRDSLIKLSHMLWEHTSAQDSGEVRHALNGILENCPPEFQFVLELGGLLHQGRPAIRFDQESIPTAVTSDSDGSGSVIANPDVVILSSSFDGVDTASLDSEQCPVCGRTFRQFRESGFLGCLYDYTHFDAALEPILVTVHGDADHVGSDSLDTVGANQTESAALRHELVAAASEGSFQDASRALRDAERPESPGRVNMAGGEFFEQLLTHCPEWLRGTGPESDIVISLRIRLARNVAYYPFPSECSADQCIAINALVSHSISNMDDARSMHQFDLNSLSPIERQVLLERQVISRLHAYSTQPRRGICDLSGRITCLINEEDHLRIHVTASGLDCEHVSSLASEWDAALSQQFTVAYHRRFGYGVSSPDNSGSGMRLTALLHLPALVLTRQFDKVCRALAKLSMDVRGLYGEGSDGVGDLYQISTRARLGQKAEQVTSSFLEVLPLIVSYERKARSALVEREHLSELQTNIDESRAMFVSGNALSAEQTMHYLSQLRLGVNLGLVPDIELPSLNELLVLVQPGHLQMLFGAEMDAATRNRVRGELLQSRLAQ